MLIATERCRLKCRGVAGGTCVGRAMKVEEPACVSSYRHSSYALKLVGLVLVGWCRLVGRIGFAGLLACFALLFVFATRKNVRNFQSHVNSRGERKVAR